MFDLLYNIIFFFALTLFLGSIARAVWAFHKNVKLDGAVDEPDQWRILVSNIAFSQVPLSLGSFESGWLDLPHTIFSGDGI